jgi:branched-subunit amino acid transport protein
MPDWLLTYGTILLAGSLATYVWRFLGVVYASRLAPDSAILDWVRAVATALIAALIMRIVLVPPGALAETSLVSRGLALVAGALVFHFGRRMIFVGVAGAYVVLLISEAAIRYGVAG